MAQNHVRPGRAIGTAARLDRPRVSRISLVNSYPAAHRGRTASVAGPPGAPRRERENYPSEGEAMESRCRTSLSRDALRRLDGEQPQSDASGASDVDVSPDAALRPSVTIERRDLRPPDGG